MELHEVKALRERRFGLTPKTAIRDASGAREFIHRVGFCFTRAEDGLLLPSFVGAVILPKESAVPAPARPGAAKAKKPAPPRSGEDIILPLLREKSVFEGRLLRERRTLVSSPFLPYFYALVGEGSPAAEAPEPGDAEAEAAEEAPVPDGEGEAPAPAAAPPAKKAKKKAAAPSAKKKAPKPKKEPAPPADDAGDGANEAFSLLEKEGPLGAKTLASKYAKATGGSADDFNAAVRRLESRLKIATIDNVADEGPVFDTFERFRPDAVREGKKLSRIEAAMRILGRYFETVIAAEAAQVGEVFGDIFPATELPDLLKTLEERKEVDPDSRLVPGRTFWICREAAWGDL